MKNRFNSPRVGAFIVVLAVGVSVIWALSAYNGYSDSKLERYDVRVKPSAVNYGTHSTASIPVVSASIRPHRAPMISGDAVRSYAYAGHAAVPSASYGSSSNFRIHTTSSATLHSVGGGGSTGGGGGFSSTGSSSPGISQSSGGFSMSMPVLAMATSTTPAASSVSSPKRFRAPDYDGSYGGEVGYDGGKIWIWDEEVWIEQGDIPVGTTKIDDGKTYRWDGSSWVLVGDQLEPGVPVGDTPYLLLLLLIALYGIAKNVVFTKKLHNV